MFRTRPMLRPPKRRLRPKPLDLTPLTVASDQLGLVRRHTQPAVAYIARLTCAAVFAYLLAWLVTGSKSSVTAPLTALLVLQATLFQTVRSALRRVGAVTAGVLLAVVVTAYLPSSWWVLGLLVAGSLAVGMILRLGEEIVEVPISAMLIFAVSSQDAAATSRVEGTVIGTAAGLAAGLIYAPLRIQPAKNAIGDLTRQMSVLLEHMADGLAAVPEQDRVNEWLEQTRALRGEIQRVDDALVQAELSFRLNPRRLTAHENPTVKLREDVTQLERAAISMRLLARSVADSTSIDSDESLVREPDTRAQLASVLGDLSDAVRVYGEDVEGPGKLDPGTSLDAPRVQLEQHLEAAKRHQGQLADSLRPNPGQHPEGWPLRGELLTHVDRLRTELQPTQPPDRGDSTGPMRVVRRRRPTRVRPGAVYRPPAPPALPGDVEC
jgi:uncharacterized membrane protein YgaE (UPF0421/DUF939 family)